MIKYKIKRFILGFKFILLAFYSWLWFVSRIDSVIWDENNITENLFMAELNFVAARLDVFNQLTRTHDYPAIDFITKSVNKQIAMYQNLSKT